MLTFLKDFPSARFIRITKAKVITEALDRCGKGRKVSISADELIRAAKNSVASNSLAKELYFATEDIYAPASYGTTG